MRSANRLTVLALVSLCACSSSKKKEEQPAPSQPAPTITETAPARAKLDATAKVERTQRPTLARKSPGGSVQNFQLLEGIEVSNEALSELYTSRGKTFIGFKANIKVLERDCLLEWKAELIEGATGRGTSVSSVSGRVPLKANTDQLVSAIVGLKPEEAAKIRSASAGFWTLCGDSMPSPSAVDVQITKTTPKQIKFGNSFDLHHTSVEVAKLSLPTQTRCYFDLVVEDIDKAGFTLNRDFASYGLASSKPGAALLRRSTFEGGNERDFEKLSVGKRAYARKLHCAGPWDAKSAKLDGIAVSKLSLSPYEGEATSADHFSRANYRHSAHLKNTMGKHCSFNLRYRLLDTSGIPLSSRPVMVETLHLRKGAAVDYQSPSHRIFAWLDQANEVGELVVEQATPIRDCKRFDPARALN